MSKVEFNDLDVEKIEQAEEGRAQFFKPEAGDNLIRIMPPWEKGELYYKGFKVHFNVDILQNYGLEIDWFAETCLAETTGSCPICALSIKAKALGTRYADEDLIEVSKKLRAKQQFISNVVNMEDSSRSVKVMQYGKQVRDALSSLFQRKGNITHPVTGYNIVVSKNKLSANAEFYTYSVSLDEKEDVTGDWDNWSKQLTDLTAVPNYSDLETIANQLQYVDLSPVVEPKTTASRSKNVDNEDVDALLETLDSSV
jgi:hypothetical protein